MKETIKIATPQDWKFWFDKKWYDLLEDYEHSEPSRTERLYHCSAMVYTYENVIVLQSYSTFVAAYDPHTGDLFINGYYSATTCQHVCKFMRHIRKLGFVINHWFNRSENSRRIYGESLEYADGVYKYYKREGMVFVNRRTGQHFSLTGMICR